MSPDFFSFFSQTVRLLEEDPSIYCISAWNDQVVKSFCVNAIKILSARKDHEEISPQQSVPCTL